MIEPYWTSKDGRHVVYCGDCRDVFKFISSVDAVITDPPYGIGKASWDTSYPDFLEEEAFKIAHTVVIMPGMWAIPQCIKNFGSNYKAIIAGHNINGMTYGPIGFNNWIPAVVGGDIPRKGQDAFDFSITNGTMPEHESPKPLAFMIKLVYRVSEEGWSVLDPFMGSGTTGAACVRLNRRFIGIEIIKEYCDIAVERIKRELSQPRFDFQNQENNTPMQLNLL